MEIADSRSHESNRTVLIRLPISIMYATRGVLRTFHAKEKTPSIQSLADC